MTNHFIRCIIATWLLSSCCADEQCAQGKCGDTGGLAMLQKKASASKLTLENEDEPMPDAEAEDGANAENAEDEEPPDEDEETASQPPDEDGENAWRDEDPPDGDEDDASQPTDEDDENAWQDEEPADEDEEMEEEETDDADENEVMLDDDITAEDSEEEDDDSVEDEDPTEDGDSESGSAEKEESLLATEGRQERGGKGRRKGGKGGMPKPRPPPATKKPHGGSGGDEEAPPSDEEAPPSDEEAPPSDVSGGDGGDGDEVVEAPSCELEKGIRAKMSKMFVHLPTALRFLFHDSADDNNLLWNAGLAGAGKGWKPVKSKARYGGIDMCLYSPLENGKPKPGHNRNLAVPDYGKKVCKALCAKVGQNSICKRGEASCAVDLTVMGSLIALERVGVTTTTMTWGRKRGDCKNVIVTPDTKSKKEMEAYKNNLALGFAPSMTGMDTPDIFHDVFKKMGFSSTDYAALMGAHSFGKVRPCADGLNGVEVGPWCGDVKRMDPPLDNSNMVPWNKGSLGEGTCNPKPWIRGNCWQQSPTKPVYAYHHTGRVAKWRLKVAKQMVARKVPKQQIANKNSDAWKQVKWPGIFKKQFGDGGFWDRTPEEFDNDYYKLFVNESFDGKDVCCGSIKNGECGRTGTMAVIGKRNVDGRASMSGTSTKTSPCEVSWCRDDRKGRQHMKSTKTWHEPLHAFTKKGHHHGVTMRMVRLPGDWALLSKKETRDAVLRFADDKDAFFEAFASAWNKVTQKGYGDSLQKCVERPLNSVESRMMEAMAPKRKRR